jgi:hypothetical protein
MTRPLISETTSQEPKKSDGAFAPSMDHHVVAKAKMDVSTMAIQVFLMSIPLKKTSLRNS